MKNKILFLENKLKSLEKDKETENKTLNDQYNFNLKKFEDEKERDIKILINKNKDLMECNEILLNKLQKIFRFNKTNLK